MREYKFRTWHKDSGSMICDTDYQGKCFKWKSEGQDIEIMQFTGLKDKNGKDIYEGDVLLNREPCRSYQDHYGDNIPGPSGHYREPLEPEIKETRIAVRFESMCDENHPLMWVSLLYDRTYMKECFHAHEKLWPEDLEYLLSEYNLKNEDELISYLGIEVIGNIHENPELLEQSS